MPLRLSAWKPGGRVGHALAGQQRDDPGEPDDPDPAGERRAVLAGAVDEARPGHDVRLAALDRPEQLRQLAGIVLAVAVEPHRRLVAALERVLEPGLDGAADADVVRAAHHRCAVRARDRGGRRRASRRRSRRRRSAELDGADRVDDVPDRAGLVVGGHDRDDAAGSLTRGTAAREAEQVEHAAGPVGVGVLVEHALAGAGAHRVRLAPGRRGAPGRRRAPGRRPRRR